MMQSTYKLLGTIIVDSLKEKYFFDIIANDCYAKERLRCSLIYTFAQKKSKGKKRKENEGTLNNTTYHRYPIDKIERSEMYSMIASVDSSQLTTSIIFIIVVLFNRWHMRYVTCLRVIKKIRKIRKVRSSIFLKYIVRYYTPYGYES